MSDAYLDYVTLIAHCEGTHASTIAFDSCVNTSISGDAPLSNLQKRFGTTSLYFDGTTHRALDKRSILSFSVRDFCFEAFIRMDALPVQGASSSPTAFRPIVSACSNVDNIFLLAVANITGVTSGPALYFRALDTALGCEVVGNFAFQGGVWYHVAISKSANRVTLFVDGNVVGTGTMDYSVYSSTGVVRYLGTYAYTGFTSRFYGYIDEVRITDGVPRYAYNTAFAPPSATFDGQVIQNADDIPRPNPAYDVLDVPFEKVGTSNLHFVSGKPYQEHTQTNSLTTIESDDVLFRNASYKSPFVSLPSGSDVATFTKRRDGTMPGTAPGLTDFVLEFFVKITSTSAGTNFALFKCNTGTTSAFTNQPFNVLYKDGKVGYGTWSNSSDPGTTTWSEASLSAGWNHIVFERSSAGSFIYVNGIPTTMPYVMYPPSVSNTYSAFFNQYFATENSVTVSRKVGCRLSEFRWTVGTSRYNGIKFNPPTKGRATGTGTLDSYWGSVMLLSPFDGKDITNAAADYKCQSFTAVSASSVNIATELSTGSNETYAPYERALKLSSGGKLVYTGVNFDMRSSDWTVEAHLNLRVKSAGGVFAFQNPTDGSYLCGLQIDAIGKLNLWYKNTVNVLGPELPVYTFMHVAISKVGLSLYMHANGTFYGPITASDLATVGITAGSFTVGNSSYTSAPTGSTSSFCISQLRITRGVARYPQSNVDIATVRKVRCPTSSGEVIAGSVLNSDSQPISRKVRIHRKLDGALLNEVVSDPTTGAFSVEATYSEPHYVIAFDTGGNAQIFDRVVPVSTV